MRDWLLSIGQLAEEYTSAFWAMILLAAFVGALLFWGGSAVGNAVIDHPLDGCLSKGGYVNRDAPGRCFATAIAPIPVQQTAAQQFGLKTPLVYDPPCGPNSSDHYCTDEVYRKTKIAGTIVSVQFNHAADEDKDHQVPDYTAIEYDPCGTDECKNETVNVCGNVLDRFNPGKSLSMIVKDSKLSDYNNCLTVYPTDLTYGGKPLTWKPTRSTVPGLVKDLPECEHPDGGTCG